MANASVNQNAASDISHVRDRIRKLLAMATHERSNEHEAEVAMKMAEKLMRQHSIDVADLEASTGKVTAYVWATAKIAIGEKAKPMSWRPRWIGFLGMGVGEFCDCKVQWSDDPTYGCCIKFMGDEADIEFVGWLFKKLRDFGYAESKSVPGVSAQDTFCKAYALRLIDRMKALRAERIAAMKAAVTKTGTALMVIQNKLVLRDAEFGRQGHGRKSRVKFASNGFTQGRAAADKVNFSRPLGGGMGQKQLS